MEAPLSRPHRVVFVAAIAPTLAHFVTPVARALKAQGWETVAVAQGAGNLEGFDRVYNLPPFRRRGLRAHFAAFRTLRQVLAREAPDVAHLHTPAAVALGRLAAACARVPSISVVHGTFLEPRSRRSVLFALAEALFAWISRQTVVVNSDDARFYRRLCRRGTVSQAPAGGAGVDVRPAGASAPPTPKALYLGRLAADKNLDFLVAVWKEARRRIPDLQLRIVGGTVDGDPPWTPPDLEGIEYAGWSDSSTEIDSAGVLVAASRREGFPMVVAEAVCAGIPVVAVENRGTREIARQVDAGLTVVPLDTARFADALVAAVRCHERRPRPDLLARWGTEATVAFHVAVITDCVDARKTGGGPAGDIMTLPLHGTNDAGRPLRVLIIGGIYDPVYAGLRWTTPETALEAGLTTRGVEVGTHPHNWEVARRQWDIVHVHHLAHQALVQPLVRAGSRLVFTRHGTMQLELKRRVVLELMYRRADAVVVLSEAERRLLGDHIPSDRVACIPNGIDGERWPYVERRRPAPGQPWHLLFVGQLSPIKNVDVLLRAVAGLDPDVPIQLDLVYHVDAQEPELRRLTADLGIEDRVRFVGRVSHVELPAYYARTHALALPSRSETLPSVITEAVLSGVPVIASAVGGVPEQLDGHGILVSPGDVGELTHAIANVVAAYDDAVRHTVPAAARARAHYTVDAMVEGHLELYRRILDRQRRGLLERRL